jgi:poly-gamma-glutamate synthesis protein (capsule biosynthesis protein)
LAAEDALDQMDSAPSHVTLFLAGDVMTGRGIDQILAHAGQPELRESSIDKATRYVDLAERAHGSIAKPVAPSYIWGDALPILADVRPRLSIANLETSVTSSDEFWPDKEVHYRMHPQNVACLEPAGIDACAIANNHVLDFGWSGMSETIATLRRAGIQPAGAGENLDEAMRPARLNLGEGGELLVFACGSESSGIPREWAAGPSHPGVYLVDEQAPDAADLITHQVLLHKRAGDLALVSIHWGTNWGYDVSAAQVDFAHRLIDGGVDLVHGHSSHHVRPIEIYEGRLVLYGCGDLITDYEGIGGYEAWRGDLGAMYFATLDRRDGRLLGLRLVPMQMERLRLARAARSDTRWLMETLGRVSGSFGSRFHEHDGDVFLQLEPAVQRR